MPSIEARKPDARPLPRALWSAFYALLLVAGVTNLPRVGPYGASPTTAILAAWIICPHPILAMVTVSIFESPLPQPANARNPAPPDAPFAPFPREHREQHGDGRSATDGRTSPFSIRPHASVWAAPAGEHARGFARYRGEGLQVTFRQEALGRTSSDSMAHFLPFADAPLASACVRLHRGAA